MAILKHVPLKNSDYGAAQRYLLFEHDELTQKPLKDDIGNMIPRTGIIETGLNCDPFTFNTECAELNRAYRKNLARKDVKAHHFIISFDPKDATENGLTPDKAHAIGVEFANRFFSGHQTLIVTHPDGHHNSGNIHCHIVINSLRKKNVPYRDFMERPTDCLAGYKHHQTPLLLKHQEDALNEICAREHLSMVDFSVPADRKVTEKEYQVKQHGQAELDEKNQEVLKKGYRPRHTDFLTVKEQIRLAIDRAVKQAVSEEDFFRLLKEYANITVKESRGVWSYVHPDGIKAIRARNLGRIYEKKAILQKIAGVEEIDVNRPEYAALPKIFLIHSDLRLVVDIQNCVKAQQSRAYARRVEISNLQQIARSVAFVQEHGIDTFEELSEQINEAEKKYRELVDKQKEYQQQRTNANKEIHYLGQYLSTKKVYAAYLKSDKKWNFRKTNLVQLEQYEEAVAYLKSKYGDTAFPSMRELQNRKKRNIRVPGKKEVENLKRRIAELRIVQLNVESILGRRHIDSKLSHDDFS